MEAVEEAVTLTLVGVEDAILSDDGVLVAVDVAVSIGVSGGVDVPEITGGVGLLIWTEG